MIPTPKYEIGQTVYRAHVTRERVNHDCPDCLGSGRWSCTSPAGATMEMSCPRCSVTHYGNDTLGLSYVKAQCYVVTLTVGSVQIDTASKEVVRYMCRETGVGSGSVYDESDLHMTAEAAEQDGAMKAADWQAALDATPEAMTTLGNSKHDYMAALQMSVRESIRKDTLAELRSELGVDNEEEIPPEVWCALRAAMAKARGEGE